MHADGNPLYFGQPHWTLLAGDVPVFLTGAGYSRHGLCSRDRERLVEYVMEKPARGTVTRYYPLIDDWAPTQLEPTRRGLVAATGLEAYDHPQLWPVRDLVAAAVRRAFTGAVEHIASQQEIGAMWVEHAREV